MKTNTAVIAGGVTGNIGSCSIVSTNISINSFQTKTVAVNSCTGEQVFQSGAYIPGEAIFLPVLISAFGILFYKVMS